MSLITPDVVARGIRKLPSLPLIITELLLTMDRDDINSQDLSDKISGDQALAAKTLRLANSSFYGMSSRVASVQQAVAILGFSSVRSLVMAASITTSFDKSAADGFDFAGFWRHAIATGVCANQLAPALRVVPETAFLAGLLHDIGQLVMATQFPLQYAEVTAYSQRNDCSVQDAERAMQLPDHPLVGQALAAHWQFPEAIQLAIAYHHDNERAAQTPLAAVVHLGNVFAHALDVSGSADECIPAVSTQAWQLLSLDADAIERKLPQMEEEYRSLSQILTL